jgi:DNA polymerase III subunit gamma/tau
MSEFIVSARKYRPDNFNSVVGQKSTTATLKNAIRTGHLAQAYLFCGPRGVGKTTCARIFAKTINCTNISADFEACNTCESCNSFNQNRSFNIHELDAASNNSIDDIRNLIDQVRIPPQVSRYSVYIIDEVHMLSQSAFNAFLKTLEEPPKHAIFILATTEKHKILPTILSRCQIFDFNRIKINDIVDYLEYIAQKEGVEYEKDALNILANKADGSMRDALSIFDQVVSFTGNKITYQKIIEHLNVLDYEYFFKLTNSFLKGDVSETLLVFDEILAKGFDAHNFINGLSRHFRDLLVCKMERTIQLLEIGEAIKEKYLEQTSRCDDDFLFSCIEVCNACDLSFKLSKNPRLHIELSLIKLCNLSEKKNEFNGDDDILIIPGVALQTQPLIKSVQEKEVYTSAIDSVHEKEISPSIVKSVQEKEVPHPVEEEVFISDQSIVKQYVADTNTPSIKTALDTVGKPKEFISDLGKDTNLLIENEFIVAEDQHIKISSEELQNLWRNFVEQLKRNEPRMYAAMKNQSPILKDGYTFEIIFNNNAQLDNFKKIIKPSLMSYLHKELGYDLLKIQEIVTDSKSVQQSKHLSDIEKIKYLTEKNPVFQKFRQEFNLDFD